MTAPLWGQEALHSLALHPLLLRYRLPMCVRPQMPPPLFPFQVRLEIHRLYRLVHDRKIVVKPHARGDAITDSDFIRPPLADRDTAAFEQNPVARRQVFFPSTTFIFPVLV